MDLEIASWTRPEDMLQARPSFAATSPAADVMGHTSAALSAVSLAFASTDAAYAKQALATAQHLYGLAAGAEGLYSSVFAPNQQVGCSRRALLCALLASPAAVVGGFLEGAGLLGGLVAFCAVDSPHAGKQVA
jgi:hypothetical protein